jgi:hypothetical protein
VDRRNVHTRSSTLWNQNKNKASIFRSDDGDDDENKKENEYGEESKEDDDRERSRKLSERWRFDHDDYPPVGPEGSDQQDRVLIDDYDAK